jgi:hypothetical protein
VPAGIHEGLCAGAECEAPGAAAPAGLAAPGVEDAGAVEVLAAAAALPDFTHSIALATSSPEGVAPPSPARASWESSAPQLTSRGGFRDPTGRSASPCSLNVRASLWPATSISRVSGRVNFCTGVAPRVTLGRVISGRGAAGPSRISYAPAAAMDNPGRDRYNGGAQQPPEALMSRRIASLVVLCLVFPCAGGGTAAGPEEARDVIEQAIRAQGGPAALERTARMVRTAKGRLSSFGADSPFTNEIVAELPDRCRWTFHLELKDGQKLRVLLVIDKDKGWRASGGVAKELGKEELDDLREEAYAAWVSTLLPLRDQRFTLSPLPEADVEGRKAAGVRVSSKARGDVQLYFDKQTHLLLKVARQAREAGLDTLKEYRFSDYKDFDGVKLPTREVDFANGKKIAEVTVTGYQFPKTLDENAFGRP